MISAQLNTGNALAELELLSLNPNKRRRLLRGAGRIVRRDSRSRLKAQKDLEGRAWQGRANGKKQRQLKKLGRHLQVHTNTNHANVTFASKRVGQVARAHQEGLTQTMTAQQAQRTGAKTYGGSATREQAKALINEGYKIRRNRGKGYKRPTVKWIMSNLERHHAGKILRILREDEPKKQWQIELPQRSFLGQDQNEQTQLKNYMLNEAMRLK